jgi:hypothetical protein
VDCVRSFRLRGVAWVSLPLALFRQGPRCLRACLYASVGLAGVRLPVASVGGGQVFVLAEGGSAEDITTLLAAPPTLLRRAFTFGERLPAGCRGL